MHVAMDVAKVIDCALGYTRGQHAVLYDEWNRCGGEPGILRGRRRFTFCCIACARILRAVLCPHMACYTMLMEDEATKVADEMGIVELSKMRNVGAARAGE